jgi:hypothetical protein
MSWDGSLPNSIGAAAGNQQRLSVISHKLLLLLDWEKDDVDIAVGGMDWEMDEHRRIRMMGRRLGWWVKPGCMNDVHCFVLGDDIHHRYSTSAKIA